MTIAKEKILLFDNDKESILLIKRVIDSYFPGKQLLTYSPGSQTLPICIAEKPDLIIVETFTTGIHGLKLIREIKDHERLRDVPIIAISEENDTNQRRNKVSITEADITIHKPFDENQLISILRICLRMRAFEKAVPMEVKSIINLLEEKEHELKNLRYNRSHTEQALRIERDFANQMLNAVGQGLTISNSNSYFQFANPAFCKMIGYDLEEVLGKSPSDFSLEESQHEIKKARRDRDTGNISSYELKMKHKNGQIIDVTVTGVPFYKNGRIDGSIAVITDISQYKKTEEKLAQLSLEYEHIFNGTQDALFLVKITENNTFEIIRNNRTHQEKTGLSLDKIAGKTPVEIFGQEIGETINNNYRRCIREGKTITYEEEIKLRHSHRWYKTSLTPISNNGRFSFIVGTTTDITEQKIPSKV